MAIILTLNQGSCDAVPVAELEVRDATPADLPALQDVYRRSSLSNEGDRANLLAHPETLVLSDRAIREGRTRAAISAGGDIIGFITIAMADRALEVDDLFVDPDVMRRGVGRRLVDDAVDIAVDRGVARLEVTANPHALAFYLRVGFVVDHEVATRFGPALRMHLDGSPSD
jgi:ribosomal protein S18 acetylase RimI-like enzyme